VITLFIDTSTDTLSVAVFKEDKLLSSVNILSNEHSSNTLTKIKDLLDKNNIKPLEVNKIMVINGPGSFTGLRIGVTIAKVYAWACNAKVIPISTLLAYAISNEGYDYYISIIDARRDHVYAGIYDKNYNKIMSDRHISKRELMGRIKGLKNIVVIGNTNLGNYEVHSKSIDANKIYNYFKEDEGIDSYALNPVYLKKTEAEEKLGDRMIRDYEEKDFNSVCILGRDINLDYVFKLSPVGKCIVYEFENEIVGFVIINLFEDRAEIIDIAVALAHRNKGIGDTLLKNAIEIAEEKNVII